MKKLQIQLKSIAKSLSALSKQVEKVSQQVEKLHPAKPALAKKKTPKKAPAKKAATPKATVKKPASSKKTSVIDTVYGLISRSRKGVAITTLREKTGFEARQLSNALYKLTKRGKIASQSRGIYVKK